MTRHPIRSTGNSRSNIAEARAHLASLSPERRAELNEGWAMIEINPRAELIGCAVFILALCFSPLAVCLIDWTH